MGAPDHYHDQPDERENCIVRDAQTRTLFINMLFPLPYTGQGVAYTLASLAKTMGGPGTETKVFLPWLKKPMMQAVACEQSLPWASRVSFRLLGKIARRKVERDFFTATQMLQRGQRVAYLWTDLSLQIYKQLRSDSIPIVREKINSGKANAKRVLDDAYARIGLQPMHGLTAEAAEREAVEMELADYVYCPNPFVETTLLEIGVPKSKLIPTSYGWEPERLAGDHVLLPPADGPTFLFVGAVCVRKGAHLLLDYWSKSKIRGRLVLAGAIEPAIRRRYSDLLNRPDVLTPDFVSDIGALYRSADVFIFPSLEEGGPQVTYEAMGCGLPAIVSPMGAGRIVRNGIDGMVIDPYDEEQWISAMQSFALSAERRKETGMIAKERAQDFTWTRVGQQRARELVSRIMPTPSTTDQRHKSSRS